MAKKAFNIILISILLFGNFISLIPGQVFAEGEGSTPSAELSNSYSSSSAETISPTPVDSSNQSEANESGSSLAADAYFDNVEVSPTPLTLGDSESGASASFENPVKLHPLSKKNYKGNEKITVIVESTKIDDLDIKVYDSSGNKAPVMVEKVNDQSPAVFRLVPPVQFKAGRYHMVVTDSEGNTLTQDFNWGVLAINTNKSIYSPEEDADIAIAVLDEGGMMVCDADVTLNITNVDLNIDDTLSIENGGIVVNPECQIKNYTEKPDYEAHYKVGDEGYYSINLTAETENGTYSISDGFKVKKDKLFDVERVNATRLFPPVSYQSIFNITAGEDFAGTIVETVPDTFAIEAIDGIDFADGISSVSAEVQAESTLNKEIPQLVLPFDGEHPISQKFGQELSDPIENKKYKDYGVVGHDGVDFDMPEDTPVLAVDDGEVVRIDVNGDYGQTIVIKHSWGKSYYGHLSLITAEQGQKILKGHPIGLSGSSGLSTFPHLHLGVKPESNDINNGYFGKVNPLSYFGDNFSSSEKNQILSLGQNDNYAVRTLSWNVDLKKGEKIQIGYEYMVPNISPQFYLLGPLQFRTTEDELIFQEQRQWQLAVDADGSGTNIVDPTTGTISTTGNIYTFTYTAAETMDSGGISITVPSGWSAPQGSAGTEGHTTVSTTGTIGTVADVMDSASGWSAGNACSSGAPTADTSVKQEGTASIRCINGDEAAGDYWYKNISSQDWSSYDYIGVWIRADSSIRSSLISFSYDDSLNLASPLESIDFGVSSANTWEYNILSFGATTRTGVLSYGFTINDKSKVDNVTVYSDYFLLGPGSPTFSGSGPWSIDIVALALGASDTITTTYGAGGGSSGVTNSSSTGDHTFTTQSKISPAGTLTNIASSPVVTLSDPPSGPTLDQLMRHGAWFSSGAEQPFTF